MIIFFAALTFILGVAVQTWGVIRLLDNDYDAVPMMIAWALAMWMVTQHQLLPWLKDRRKHGSVESSNLPR